MDNGNLVWAGFIVSVIFVVLGLLYLYRSYISKIFRSQRGTMLPSLVIFATFIMFVFSGLLGIMFYVGLVRIQFEGWGELFVYMLLGIIVLSIILLGLALTKIRKIGGRR